MPFTGRIGTQNSRFGDIVLGIVDAFDLPTVGFRVHVLSSREVRVRFDRPVTDSALATANYLLFAITAGAYVPAVVGVDFYDADRLSVVVRTSVSLTWQSLYAIQVVGVTGFDGEGVTSDAANFTANVPDGARAVGAFLSRRGMVDLVFDRPVGQTAIGATAMIRDADGGPGVPMILQSWAGEAIPEDTLRFVYPVTTPTAASFMIDYASVVDSSNNVGSGTVPLSLRLRSSAPYNSSSLSQMQILDAYVSEIVPNVNAATLRVYFDGPALVNDVLDLGSWNITQPGPHSRPDIVHSVLVPDCVTLFDCFNFLNAVRTVFAAHVLEDSIHARVSPALAAVLTATPPATTYVTATALFNAIRDVFKNHATAPYEAGTHLYPEPVPIPEPPTFEDQPAFIVLTNELKALYNQHLAADRSLPYAGDYPLEIGFITDHASSSKAFPVRNDLTYFADVHVTTAVAHFPIRVRATVRSEDLGSTTDPLLFSGDIVARAALAPGVLLTKEVVLDREVRAAFDKEVLLTSPETFSIQNDPYGPLSLVHAVSTSTVPDATWFLNSLVFAYSKHLSPTPVGAGHLLVESQYFVVPSDYVTTTDLPTLTYKANILKMKLNGHLKNANVHTNVGGRVMSPDAFDFPSLVRLLAEMRTVFVVHNESGDFEATAGNPPRRPGRHNTPGLPFLVTKLMTAFVFDFDGMMDNTVHRLRARVADAKWDLLWRRPTSSPVILDTEFLGFATRPSVASALPRPGLIFHEDREGKLFYSFEPDSIEVYFSKRMQKTELNGGTGSSISITGGSLVLNKADWVDERTASVRVAQMEQISYTLNAAGLVDTAGNPIV